MSSPFAILRGWECLEISGPDAKDFLNRLTSADFRNLDPGRLTPALLLAANGKIIQYAIAACVSEGRYVLAVPPTSQAAYEAFEKMHFRESLEIRPLGDTWLFLRILVASPGHLARLENTALAPLVSVARNPKSVAVLSRCDLLAFNPCRWNAAPILHDLGILIPAARKPECEAILAAAGFSKVDDLEGYRLRAADPGPPNEINSGVLPLEARLDDAVHEGKGCYPGQEVIERIRSMGQPPRKLVAMRGQGNAPAVPAPIVSEEVERGSLTSAAADPVETGWVGLGFLRRVAAAEGARFEVGGQPVEARVL